MTNININAPSVQSNVPTLTPSTVKATNVAVTVEASFSVDSVTKEVKVDEGSWMPYTEPIVLNNNGIVAIRERDDAGNYSDVVFCEVVNIDKEAPVKASVIPGSVLSTNQNVELTVIYPSDAYLKEYRIDFGEWNVYTDTVKMVLNGTFEARSQDEAGNWSDITSYEVLNINKTSPLSPIIEIFLHNKLSLNGATGEGFNIDRMEYSLNDGEWVNYKSLVHLVDGEYTIKARIVDSVGNISEPSSAIVTIYKEQLVFVQEAIEQSELLITQDAVNIARTAVENLPTIAFEKERLIMQITDIQGKLMKHNSSVK